MEILLLSLGAPSDSSSRLWPIGDPATEISVCTFRLLGVFGVPIVKSRVRSHDPEVAGDLGP